KGHGRKCMLGATASRISAGCGVRVTSLVRHAAARPLRSIFGLAAGLRPRRNVAAGCGVNQRFAQSAEEVAMTSYVRPACLALAFVATAAPAGALTAIYERRGPRAPGPE